MIKTYTCPVSGDKHDLAVRVGGDAPVRALSPLTAFGLLRLAGVPELEWVRVAEIQGPGGQKVRLVLDSSTTELNEKLEAAGRSVRHGDIYETDSMMQGENADDKSAGSISGVVERRTVEGQRDTLTRADLTHPDAAQYLELMSSTITAVLASRNESEPDRASETVEAELEGGREDESDRGDEGQDLPDGPEEL